MTVSSKPIPAPPVTDTVPTSTPTRETIVAIYRDHGDAEAAVRRLAAGGVPIAAISIVGRNFQTREDVTGFYRPADAALVGASEGAWYGGLFGLMLGALGFFIFPVVGGIVVLGPLSGLIAGAISGAGVGALVSALMAAGIPRDQALLYQGRLEAGEFLVLVHGSAADTARARAIFPETDLTGMDTHGV